jgi:ATP-dependent Lon protease
MASKYNIIISRELIALPSTENTIIGGRTKTVNVVKKYLEDPKVNKKFILLTQENPDVEDPKLKDVYTICTLCEIISVKPTKKDVYSIKFKCIKRMMLLTLNIVDNMYVGDAEILKDQNTMSKEIPTKLNILVELFKKYAIKEKSDSEKLHNFLSSKSVGSSTDEIIDFVTIGDYSKYKTIRKDVLQEVDVVKRIAKGIEFFEKKNTDSTNDELRSKVDLEINKKVNETLSKQQKEFYLREKMKAVKDELGKINPGESDINSYKKRLEENPYPNHIKEKVLGEINKMESNSFSQENAITKQYIE